MLLDKAQGPRLSVWQRLFPRLDRFIIQALWMPWLFSFGAFTTISFSIGALFSVLRRLTAGTLSGTTAMQVLALQLPSFMVLALPMSLLLAPLLTYSRLARGNELLALQGCGVSVYRLARPTLGFSLVVAICTLVMNEQIVPPATLKADTLLANQPAVISGQSQSSGQQATAIASIPERNIVHRLFADQQLTQLLYARTFDGNALHHFTLLQFKDRHLQQMWIAQRAIWKAEHNQWSLSEGTHYTIAPKSGLYQQVVSFQQQLVHAVTPHELATASRQPISIAETSVLLHRLQHAGDTRYLRKLQIRLHALMAFPGIGVGFGMIGAALGCQTTHHKVPSGFGLSLILIFAYYLFSFICQTLGNAGLISARLAGWLPISTLFAIGVILLQRTNTSSARS